MDWITSIETQDWCLIGICAVLFIVTLVDVLDAHRHSTRRPQ